MDGSAAHPQVVLAAEGLQQLLVVSVTHLTQQGQQAGHKLPLVAREGRQQVGCLGGERREIIIISFISSTEAPPALTSPHFRAHFQWKSEEKFYAALLPY